VVNANFADLSVVKASSLLHAPRQSNQPADSKRRNFFMVIFFWQANIEGIWEAGKWDC
jgi:hypothetical protein